MKNIDREKFQECDAFNAHVTHPSPRSNLHNFKYYWQLADLAFSVGDVEECAGRTWHTVAAAGVDQHVAGGTKECVLDAEGTAEGDQDNLQKKRRKCADHHRMGTCPVAQAGPPLFTMLHSVHRGFQLRAELADDIDLGRRMNLIKKENIGDISSGKVKFSDCTEIVLRVHRTRPTNNSLLLTLNWHCATGMDRLS